MYQTISIHFGEYVFCCSVCLVRFFLISFPPSIFDLALFYSPPLICAHHSLQGQAKGKLYIDDGHSYKYKEGEYLVRQFTFSDDQLTGGSGDQNGSYTTKSWLERVLVVGVTRAPSSINIQSGGENIIIILLYR